MSFATQTAPFAKLALLALGLSASTLASAQNLKFGPRFGVGASGIEAQDLVIRNENDVEALRLQLQNASPEVQMGVFGRVSLLGLYVQPEVLLATSSARYLYEDAISGGTELLKEQYYRLEVPVMFGLKLGPLRAQGGPVFHTPLANASELTTISGLSRSYRESSTGIQAGLGLDLGKKVVFDVKYEANLSGVRDEITIFGQSHAVSTQGSRVIASLGISI